MSNNKADTPFDLTHYDLWGKYHTTTYNDSHYFLTIVDDYSRGSWVCLMNNKTEMLQHLMNFCNLIKKKFNKHITRIQSKNGTKFMNFKIEKFTKKEGIIHESSCVSNLTKWKSRA